MISDAGHPYQPEWARKCGGFIWPADSIKPQHDAATIRLNQDALLALLKGAGRNDADIGARNFATIGVRLKEEFSDQCFDPADGVLRSPRRFEVPVTNSRLAVSSCR